MTDARGLSALDLAAAIRDGVSPVEATQDALTAAEQLDEALGLFITRTPDLALEQARDAQARLLGAGPDDDLPPLLGVPCPVTDHDQVAGVPLTFGSSAFTDVVCEVDDGTVTLLHRAGTVMTGKTNIPEAGLPCYTEPDVAPPARTPWDLTRSAGGSSGGAAAVVAAGVAPIALGADGGGSIRIPASACGVVGLKPTRGRVSPAPFGVDNGGLVAIGPLSRTVADAAAMLDVLAQGWPGDVAALPTPDTTFVDSVGRPTPRLRIGVLTDPVIVDDVTVHPACLAAAEQVAGLLSDLGHHVAAVGVPFPADQWAAFAAIWSSHAAALPVPPDREHLLRPMTAWLREQGRSVSATDYIKAMEATQYLARQVAAAWTDVDVVLSPTLADLPAPVGSLRDDDDPPADFAAQMRFTPWTSVWNLIGRPAISLPLGWHAEGSTTLPVGVMLGAGFGQEELLLSLSAELERAAPWYHRYTPLWRALGQTGQP